MSIEVIRGGDRAVSRTDWLLSRHGFSFGDHYDPSNTHHGVLLVNNDEVVEPLQGFDTHPHRESEIVTWVMSGSLVHQDSEGHSGIVYPGLAQRMSAGTGVLHSERNDTWSPAPGAERAGRMSPAPGAQRAGRVAAAGSEPVRFVQMWVMPDESGLSPSYAQHDIADELVPGCLVPVASGDPQVDSAIRIANRAATLYVARPVPGSPIAVPASMFTHLYVTRGAVRFGDDLLVEGDSVRAGDIGGEQLLSPAGNEIPSGPDHPGTEVLIWSMNTSLRALMGA